MKIKIEELFASANVEIQQAMNYLKITLLQPQQKRFALVVSIVTELMNFSQFF